ncbi:MAG: YigZ family protein [Bacteroidetes bacterium]|nr:YigZ family protein [Bacteroidota bacterium]
MTGKEIYYTIGAASEAQFSDRGSKFIAFAFPVTTVEEVKSCLNKVKGEHPKATHHCFAWRLGLDGNSYRVSDDGEPSGSAGRPILGQIDSKEITNTLVVVARYFGGTLLGVPGLINAYKTATSLALQITPVIQKQVEVSYRIQFDYTCMNQIMMVVKQFNCSVISQELQLFCMMTIGVPKSREEDVLFRLRDVQNIEIGKI